VCFAACSVACSFLLFRNHNTLAASYWASGLALIAAVLPVYYGIKTEGSFCHLTTAKWTAALVASAGVCLLFYGFIRWVEVERQSNGEQSRSQVSWSAQEIKIFALAIMLFVSVYLLEVRLIMTCWW
jgi:uncharacterized membrane protein YidH (DUF202 family)